jgi:protein transport protein SEC31
MNGLSSSTETTSAKIPYKLATTGSEGLICEALLTGNISAAVELCMNAGRSTDAIILASLGGSELLARTQYKYLKSNDSFIANLISAMVMADWSGVISQCTIDSWKEALVAALTHSKDQSSLLCERLGERMQIESGGDSSLIQSAILCYICAGNIERIVDAWSAINGNDCLEDSTKLQELVEIVTLLNKGMERHGQRTPVFGKYAELLSKYASLLAAQGSLEMALTYIGTSQDDPKIVELRERLSYALGHKQQFQPKQSIPSYQNPYQTGIRNAARTMSTSSAGGIPSLNTFNTGLPNASSNQFDSMWNQPPAAVAPPTFMPTSTPQVPMMPRASLTDNSSLPQPPRPSSVSSASSQPSATVSNAKPKRLLDPSVSSNMGGGGYGQLQPAIPFNPNSNAFNNQTAAFNSQQTAFNNQPSTFNTNPIMTTQPTTSGWDQQANYGYQSMGMNGNLPPPPAMSSQPIQRNPTPSNAGWNDPPEFKTKSQVCTALFSLLFIKSYLQRNIISFSTFPPLTLLLIECQRITLALKNGYKSILLMVQAPPRFARNALNLLD